MHDCIDHGKVGTKAGYSYFRQPKTRQQILRHRYAYCIYHGIDLSTIEGKVVRHTCDNPRCINPLHLLLGTHADNVRDKVERNRQAKHERHGRAVLTAEAVSWIRNNYEYRSREYGGPALARKFGVGYSTVKDILTHSNWR